MIRVLRRLRQLRHVHVVGALGVARVDVCAGHAVGLLDGGLLSFLYPFSFLFRNRRWGLCGRKEGREDGGEELRTGSCDMMDWNCAGFKRPESRRNSSSVRMVPRERLAAAGSTPIVVIDLWMDGWMD